MIFKFVNCIHTLEKRDVAVTSPDVISFYVTRSAITCCSVSVEHIGYKYINYISIKLGHIGEVGHIGVKMYINKFGVHLRNGAHWGTNIN